ncbi:MAG: S41 family peptidase [Chloroflexi bacterium]|nr:MAG: S41 family peptidase [Chloroflexota bacterium]
MSEFESEKKPSLSKWIIGLLAIVVVFGAGVAVGRLFTNPTTEPVTNPSAVEAGEQAGPAGGAQQTQNGQAAPDQPTAIPTTDNGRNATQFEIRDVELDVFYEAWDIIEQEFDGELPPEDELLHAIIQGSIETLDDQFTRYIPPEIAARLREDMGGSVEGIGAFVRENEEGQIEIVRPIDGQPADLAGLKPGDIIIGVDGEDVTGQSLDEVVLKVRGPRGTQVTLTIMRPGEPEPLEFTITRTRFEIPIIEAEMLENDIAYVRLTEFNRNAEERLRETLEELLAQNPRALIFDLRDNPGGFLDQSVAVADMFLPEGVVLFERNGRGLEQVYQSDDGDLAEEIPLVVLVNAGSASASEIVAGALRDNGRAILIGETTFGKGSVQQVHTLSDGSELRVTIARWYTPSNNTIDKQGIAPDIEVATPEDLGGENDTQLQRAIEYILNGE